MPRLLSGAALVLGGCLITNPVEIGEPINSPPALRSPPDAAARNVAMNQIITVLFDPNGEIEIPIVVRDENVNDDLVAMVWIDFREGATPDTFTGFPLQNVPQTVPKTGVEERDFTVSIPHARLGDQARCHRIEVLVTREFEAAMPLREPEEEGDIGSAVFWVAMKPDALADPVMSTCP